MTLRPHALLGSGLLALLIGCSSSSRPVAVGAALSTPFIDAVRMAIEDVGMPTGMPVVDTVLRYEWSNRAAPAIELVDAFRKVRGLVGVVGHSNSSASLATAPLYNRDRVVQIAPTSTAADYSSSGEFSFRLVPPDPEQGGFIADFIDSTWPGGARLALMYVNDDYGRGLRTALLARLDTLRHPIVHEQPHTDDEFVSPPPDRERRVRTTVAAMLTGKPDVVLWLGRPSTFALYLEAIRESAGAIPIVAGDAFSNWFPQDRGNGNWHGIRYVDFLDLNGSDASREFVARYQVRFGRRAGSSELLSYDAMRLLLAAIEDGCRSGDDVRRWLMSLGRERPPYPGASGPISFDANGDIARSYVMVTIDSPRR
jgi:branched-chain amino acid transport system substrate-binding protein